MGPNQVFLLFFFTSSHLSGAEPSSREVFWWCNLLLITYRLKRKNFHTSVLHRAQTHASQDLLRRRLLGAQFDGENEVGVGAPGALVAQRGEVEAGVALLIGREQSSEFIRAKSRRALAAARRAPWAPSRPACCLPCPTGSRRGSLAPRARRLHLFALHLDLHGVEPKTQFAP